MRRRFLAKLLVFLLLGAIVNVAVAWVIFATSRSEVVGGSSFISFEPSDPAFWQSTVISRFGIVTVHAEAWKAGPTPPPSESLPWWSATRTPPENWSNYYKRAAMREVAYGWPFVCAYGRIESAGAVLFWPTRNPTPRTPLWPGFAINTVFYAAILWMLFAAPFALRGGRRRRRIKHGLCPACAYPVGTSDKCTECGTPVGKQKAENQKAEMTT